MATGKLNNEKLQKSSSDESLAWMHWYLKWNILYWKLKTKKTYKAQWSFEDQVSDTGPLGLLFVKKLHYNVLNLGKVTLYLKLYTSFHVVNDVNLSLAFINT